MTRALWPRGCLEVYTGDGKGKTTAALGLALRAAGHGLQVFVGQFMKRFPYGELAALGRLGDAIVLEQFGAPECIPWREVPDARDVELAGQGLARAREVLASDAFDIVILDEVNVAVHFRLLRAADIVALADARPPGVELVLTGRYASEEILARADLVTEMRSVKHPFDTQGLAARDGIER